MRVVARETLSPHGYEVVAGEGSDPAGALDATGAVLAVLGRAAQMEGATVVAVSVYRDGTGAPVSLIRVVGIGLAQLRADLHAKLPNQLASALGLRAPAAEAK